MISSHENDMATASIERQVPGPISIMSNQTSTDQVAAPRRSQGLDSTTPVNQDGCFEFDRIIKSGYVRKRKQRTKAWKEIYIVLRPSTLSIYKNQKESKLRHQIHLTDLTAVARLTDPKGKRNNLLGLFTSSKNYHFEAPTQKDAEEWVELIRKDARIEEEEEELFLASASPRPSTGGLGELGDGQREVMLSSSPEPVGRPAPTFATDGRRASQFESSGMSGNELASHSDFSDSDARAFGTSIEDLASPTAILSSIRQSFSGPNVLTEGKAVPPVAQQSVATEQDMDRVVWQGWVRLLRSRRGVRQWKKMWGVLRPRNLILYKDESEYIARWILDVSMIVNVVDIDPLSKSKTNCLQIITEEKSYKLCLNDEESLVQCMGALKSLLAKRRGLEAGRVSTSQ